MTDFLATFEFKAETSIRYYEQEKKFTEFSIYYDECKAVVDELKRLRARVAEAEQTIEDVALGATIKCEKCGNYHPCSCDK